MESEKKKLESAESGGKSQSLVPVSTAARLLGFHPAVVYAKIRRGEWPSYRIGSAWRIDISEIRALGRRGAARDVERRRAKGAK